MPTEVKYFLLLFLFYFCHGGSLGLSDDEAYYWLLAQKPALGYAFHPPAVAWLISLSESLFRYRSSWVTRAPAILGSSSIFFLGLIWLKAHQRSLSRGALSLLSFSGFFALAWMIVPDVPLFLGWMIAFLSVESLCTREEISKWSLLGLGFGVCLAVLSKYSGVLVGASAALCCLERRKLKPSVFLTLLFSGLLGLAPSLYWNSEHHWSSLLYQLQERHSGNTLSWGRYLRFWMIQLVIAGPLSILTFFGLFKRSFQDLLARRILIWALPPALVYCIQPLFSDFKPHWALIVWWPCALYLSYVSAEAWAWKWIRYQVGYGLFLTAVLVLGCHLPVGGYFTKEPKMDVTNDFYGWSELSEWVATLLPASYRKRTLVGSRYQTASQAQFALPQFQTVLLPRDEKQRDEWPQVTAVSSIGPDWPELNESILYLTDNRYDLAPQFPNAKCEKLGKYTAYRGPFVAKWFELWGCDPQ